jgi:hypothetical protein
VTLQVGDFYIFCSACGAGFHSNVLSCPDCGAPARRVRTRRPRSFDRRHWAPRAGRLRHRPRRFTKPVAARWRRADRRGRPACRTAVATRRGVRRARRDQPAARRRRSPRVRCPVRRRLVRSQAQRAVGGVCRPCRRLQCDWCRRAGVENARCAPPGSTRRGWRRWADSTCWEAASMRSPRRLDASAWSPSPPHCIRRSP